MSLKEIADKREKDEQSEKDQADQNRKRAKYHGLLKAAFFAEQNNPNLIMILKFLFTFCAYDSVTDVSKNIQTAEVSALTTLYNSTLRSVYARLREFMPKQLKIKVEFGD